MRFLKFFLFSLLLSLFFLSSGCSFLMEIKEVSNNSTILDPNIFQSAGTNNHQSEVVLINPTKISPYKFISVAKNGSIFGWKDKEANPDLIRKFKQIDLAFYQPNFDQFIFSEGRQLNVVEGLLSSSKIKIYSKNFDSKILSLSSSGEHSVIFGTLDSTLYRWRYGLTTDKKSEKEKVVERYYGPNKPISSLAYHPKSKVFFDGDWGGDISAWKPYDSDRLNGEYDNNAFIGSYFAAESTRSRAGRSADKEVLSHLIVNSTGQELIAATNAGVLEIWKVRGLIKAGFLQAHTSTIFSIAFSPSGKYVASAGRDGLVRVFELYRLSEEEIKKELDRTIVFQLNPIHDFQVSNVRAISFIDENQLAAGTNDGSVLSMIW